MFSLLDMLSKEEFHLKQNVEPFIHYREKQTTFECITRENIEAVAAKVPGRQPISSVAWASVGSSSPRRPGASRFSVLQVGDTFTWGSTSHGESCFCLVGRKIRPESSPRGLELAVADLYSIHILKVFFPVVHNIDLQNKHRSHFVKIIIIK